MDSSYLVRPLVAGILSAGLNYKVLGESDWNKNGQFAVAVSAGIALADTIAPSITKTMGAGASSSAIATRVTEIVFGSGSSFAINKYVFGNTPYNYDTTTQDLMKKTGVVVVADVVSNMLLDLVSSKPVSLFN